VKGNIAAFALITLTALIFLPTVFNSNMVLAQSSSYTIQSVEHNVEVLFSGHIVVRDEIKVSGSLANGFLIGLPATFSGSVLKVVAYDEDQSYSVDMGVTLGSQSGFYGAKVNFNGENPNSFTVVFVLSNSLFDQDTGYYILDYPAYPSFTTVASSCSVTLSLTAEPYTITISKSDGAINATTYSKTNLAAYTNIPARAVFYITYGLLQLNTISSLNRQVTIDPAGIITCSDSYHITNIDAYTMYSFLFNLPSTATNVGVKDDSGRILTSESLGNAGSIIIVNATLPSYVAQDQSLTLTATYNLPNSGNTFNFELFPAVNYYANQGSVTFTFPEGATIISPQANDLDSTLKITKEGYKEVLSITRQGVSYVDYSTPDYDTVHISYDYSPLWSSLTPTFWAFGISAIACIGIVFWRKSKTAEEKTGKMPIEKHVTITEAPKAHTHAEAPKVALHTNRDLIHRFIKEYDERTEISNEMNALDQKAQKGKIPRRQYKVQRRTLEVHYETLTKNINEAKKAFQSSGGALVDLVEELDLAEVDYNKADKRIKALEAGQRSGEISIEEYKENIDDYKAKKEKAESVVNGILLRIREKIH
jgi:hypothetical protein